MSDRQYGRPSRVILEWDEVEAADEQTPAAPAQDPPAASAKAAVKAEKETTSGGLRGLLKGLRRQDR
ncbi:hypothetical protein [Deinococcus navajonensis]|uniref:Uncharacterized protein n=1 Tax=Deinococcus navajonensis TaxID=309884 RepID=A0ABV8XSM1_9DEIO